jgi:hypothetical protein
VCLAGLGEALGILLVSGATFTVWVLIIIVLLLISSVLFSAWYILQKYVAGRGGFGLHYFVGASDTSAPAESSKTQVQN